MVSIWRKRAAADLGIEPSELSDGHWQNVDWRHWKWTLDDRKDLLRTCITDVPRVIVENGIEREERYATPHSPEVSGNPYLEFLAKELSLGELEAEVLAEQEDVWPASTDAEWDHLQSKVRTALQELMSDPREVSKGDSELSQQNHAKLALENLDAIEIARSWILSECLDENERARFSEAIAIAAQHAFAAGQHARVSFGKRFEKFADTGQRHTKYLNQNREGWNKRQSEPVKERRAEIARFLPGTRLKGRPLRESVIRVRTHKTA